MIEFRHPDIVTAAALLLAAAGIYILWRREKDPIFVFWRGATVLALLLALFQPGIISAGGERRPIVAVAFDTSRSMQISGRMSSAAFFLKQNLGELEKYFRPRLYGFDAGARDGFRLQDIGSVKGGTVTDLSRSLREIRREGGEALAGIVLISDGNQTGGEPGPRWLAELGVPVFTVGVGTRKKIRDGGIETLRIGDLAFKNTPVEVTARIRSAGCAGEKAAVVLKRTKPDAKILSSRVVTLGADGEGQDVTLSMTPEASGRFEYAVELQPVTGEITLANNVKPFALSVMREKLRVLYICGQPGPEYAFLRQALKSDPVVELVSFVILRNPENIALVPENDLSLIPFPVHTIFTRDLYDFDLLVLENFSYRRFGFLPDYFVNIRKWVLERGGGVIMIGGPGSFGPGGWTQTPVGEILPLGLKETGESFDNGLFRPRPADFNHPVMRLADEPAGNESIWRSLPELDGCQRLDAKPGASVLAAHPWTGGPVIAVWDRGKGRVMAVASNTTWRWALMSRTPEVYGRFWKNAVRYVTRARDEKRLSVQFDRPVYSDGQDFAAHVSVSDKSPGYTVEAACTGPSGKRSVLPVTRRAGGSWSLKGSFGESGSYRIKLSLEKNGSRVYGDTLDVNVVPSTAPEESALDVNETMLREISSATGGEYFAADSFSAGRIAPKLAKKKEGPASERKALWDSAPVMMIIAVSFLGEWFMRRKRGAA